MHKKKYSSLGIMTMLVPLAFIFFKVLNFFIPATANFDDKYGLLIVGVLIVFMLGLHFYRKKYDPSYLKE